MEYFDDPDWINAKFGPSYADSGYTIADDMEHFKKINEHVKQIATEYLEDEIKHFRKIQNKLRYGNDLTEKDREFFKLFYETLDNLYSNIGQIINHVYSVSIGKNN